jgi:hypothetical protein
MLPTDDQIDDIANSPDRAVLDDPDTLMLYLQFLLQTHMEGVRNDR